MLDSTYSYLRTDNGRIFETLYAGIIEAITDTTNDNKNIPIKTNELIGVSPICRMTDIPKNETYRTIKESIPPIAPIVKFSIARFFNTVKLLAPIAFIIPISLFLSIIDRYIVFEITIMATKRENEASKDIGITT